MIILINEKYIFHDYYDLSVRIKKYLDGDSCKTDAVEITLFVMRVYVHCINLNR